MTTRFGARSPASRASIAACSTLRTSTRHAGRVTIVDDYGHHPTEVAATLQALRQGYAGRRLVLAFQPHRYTRTRDLIDDFGKVLSGADVLFVTEVYAAGEAPIAGADGRAICRAVRTRGQVEPVFVEKVEELAPALADVIARQRSDRHDGRRAYQCRRARLASPTRTPEVAVTVAVAPEFMLRVRRNEPMSRHTSWHVGGPAEVFFNPHDRTDLAAFLRALPPEVRFTGSGSAAICWCAMAAWMAS